MINNLSLMRQESQADFHEATELLHWLIELTEPSDQNPSTPYSHSTEALGVITEGEHEGLIDISPPRVVEHRNMMRDVWQEMNKDISEGGCFFRGRPTAEPTTHDLFSGEDAKQAETS